MSEEELKQYHDDFVREFGEPETQEWPAGRTFHNAPRTDRKAWRGISWINYWRAMTGRYNNGMKCANCGKDIFAEIDGYMVKNTLINNYNSAIGGSLEDYQANGGHLFKNGDNAHDGYWIIPLCKECNNFSNRNEMRCKEATTVCEERGAHEVESTHT